jgi:hypothetical protein
MSKIICGNTGFDVKRIASSQQHLCRHNVRRPRKNDPPLTRQQKLCQPDIPIYSRSVAASRPITPEAILPHESVRLQNNAVIENGNRRMRLLFSRGD